jgi:predicted nucleotidyltransferase
MKSLLGQKQAQLEALCRRYHVRRLELFGSATSVDLVVASAITNPYFRQSVERTKTLLYAA